MRGTPSARRPFRTGSRSVPSAEETRSVSGLVKISKLILTVTGQEAGTLSVSNRTPRKAEFLGSKHTASAFTLGTAGRHVPFRERPDLEMDIILAVPASGLRTETLGVKAQAVRTPSVQTGRHVLFREAPGLHNNIPFQGC